MSGICRRLLIRGLLIQLLSLASSDSQTNDVIREGNEIIEDFFHRYNTTKEVDLVFILDRSGSVPRSGWSSMINFVEDILEHFTVDKDNTRVAIVTYSTSSTVDINDLEPGTYSDGENKCTLKRRIEDYIQRKIPYGYTATYDALNNTYDILLNSRPNAKKAVFVLTDGKSNIGPPPVKVAFDLLSLQWDDSWNETYLGPQVEIYAFGIEQAEMAELKSMASKLPNHVFLIPNFQLFENLARSLHGDRQEEKWIPAQKTFCGDPCVGLHAHCMCGTRIGQYACVCSPGYQVAGLLCAPCAKGFYKSVFSPDACQKCPVNMTTEYEGATDPSQCRLLPGLRECPALPDITHGRKFRVAGVDKNEVMNTGVSCDPITDGNSCHYECEEGYRLTGTPVMICNASGLWEGTVPSCTIVDCHKAGTILEVPNAEVDYINGTTTHGSHLSVSCNPGRVSFGKTYWECNRYGHWTQPSNFQCVALFCEPLKIGPFLVAGPSSCTTSPRPVDQSCSLSCWDGFQMVGPDVRTCTFEEKPTWLPQIETQCIDIEPPTITCPETLRVQVPDWDGESTTVHYDSPKPVITDNSGVFIYTVNGVPKHYNFSIGQHPLEYVASDDAGNTASCTRIVIVEGKSVVLEQCPSDISVATDQVDRSTFVTWPELVFLGAGNTPVDYTCNPANGSKFYKGEHTVRCHDQEHSAVTCAFNVNVTAPECAIPFSDRRPANGALGCEPRGSYPLVCRIQCEFGHELTNNLPDHHIFRCDWDGTWNIDEPWPACQSVSRRRAVEIRNGIVISYKGNCEDDKEKIKTGLRRAMDKIFGQVADCDSYGCGLEQIQILCGGRSKRSVLQPRRIPRDASPQNISITFAIRGTINKSKNEITAEDQGDLINFMDGDLYNTMFATFEQLPLQINISGVEQTVTEFFDVTPRAEFAGNCSEGQVRDFLDTSARCLSCAQGTYFSDNECLHCPLGTYQDEEAQLDCKKCPNGTNTTLPGAQNLTDCADPCQPGFTSTSGYSPCEPCPTGTYQDSEMSAECSTCPNGTSTVGEGASDILACVLPCSAQTYSSSGLQPCQICPLNTTSGSGSRECVPCRAEDPSHDCPAIMDCPDGTPCIHGECVSWDGASSVCQCHPGYYGNDCEYDVDECLEVECLNNGTCQQGINSFECICQSGFAGELCGEEVNECDSSPCQNTGYCQDRVGGYYCYCSSGFTGEDCQINIDECVNHTCKNGSCTDLVDGYQCDCDAGYGGEYCELLVDHCVDILCENGGQCENVGSTFQCQCKDGFIGTYCEDEQDNCLSNPCQNNATCLNKQNGFICKCTAGFAGISCQKEVPGDFDLIFPNSPTPSYVKLTEVEDLYAFTVSLWLRTMDTTKYGTILSYAAESNWLEPDNSNVLTLYDYGRLQVVVNGMAVHTNISLNTGWWQHLCVTWMGTSGEWSVKVNGSRAADGVGLARDTFLQGGGVLVLGQEQDTVGGGFNAMESFTGEMSQLNMFDRVLRDNEIAQLADKTSCQAGEGNVVAWTNTLDAIVGSVAVRRATLCLDANQCNQGNLTCPADYQCVKEGNINQCKPCDLSDDCGGVNTCAAMPCLNGAQCIDGPAAMEFSCVCMEGFTGNLCEVSLEGCVSEICQNGGTCKQLGATIYCACPPGYAGVYCETEQTGGCVSDPCLNGAACVPNGDFYSCVCLPGFHGARCDRILDQCVQNPCQHNGTCVNALDRPGFTCTCQPPYVGKYCHITNRLSCDQSPCLNGGNCSIDDSLTGYQCSCPQSSTVNYGPNCELPTACDGNPCLNGGICVVRPPNEYLCDCINGHTGLNCEGQTTPEYSTTTTPTSTDGQDNCAGVHCDNGGTCSGKVDAAPCTCPIDYEGDYCKTARKKEERKYAVSLTLLMKYTKSLRHDKSFIGRFRKQVRTVYKPAIVDSKLQINVKSIRPGSAIVDFEMDHVVYLESSQPIYDLAQMRSLLVESLRKGKVGNLDAVMDENFDFSSPRPKPIVSKSSTMWVFVLLAVLIILVLASIGIGVYVCRKKRSRPVQKQNNIPHTYLNQINNPTFESSFEAPQLKNITEETIYAEPGEFPKPVASGGRFPAKGGKDINKEWALRQRIPLPLTPAEEKTIAVARMSQSLQPNELPHHGENDYLAPCRGTPPPSYRDLMGPASRAASLASIPECAAPEPPTQVKPLNTDPPEDSVYFTPISEEEKLKLVKESEASSSCQEDPNTPGKSNPGYTSRSNSGSVASLIPEDNESLELAPGQYLPMTADTSKQEEEPADGGYVPPTPSSANEEPEYAIRGPLTSIS